MNLHWIVLTFNFYFICVSSVHIEKNGYKDISIAFSDSVQLSSIDFEKLKTVLRKASELLFRATRRRSFFEEFVLVVPSIWMDSNGACEEEYESGALEKVDISITGSTGIPYLRTQHSKGCGKEGDIIYMSLDWLKGETGDLALQFVQQWSIFRYGVFSENPERPGSCFANSDHNWSPTGCYNTELNVEAEFDEKGLPVCYFPEGFNEREDLNSSIMFSTNSSKVESFCDGSKSFPHNPVADTLHNRICSGQTVWSVIQNTDDFIYGRNLPLEGTKPPNITTFRCFRQSKTEVTLAVQNSSLEVISEALTEIRYALYHFLSTMVSSDFSVNLVTFSNTPSKPVSLNLANKTKLDSILDTHIKQIKPVSSVCFICSLKKAYEIANLNQYSSQVVVLLSWESSLENSKTSDLIDLIQSNHQTVVYLLLVEDRVSDIVPPALVDTVQATRGQVFRLKSDAVSMVTQLNIALLDAFKNPLNIEDKTLVVHEKMYENVTTNFTDTFLTPNIKKGRLLYTMHCHSRGIIRNVHNTCSDWDTESQSYKCGVEKVLSNYETPVVVWKHRFERVEYIRPIRCSSLALLRLESPSSSIFTVRGWFNEKRITPGYNVLIIFAEVTGRKTKAIQVEAIISGPGLKNFVLELRDNGNGDPDIMKGDGIYSRYFTSFTQKGTYTVTARATYPVAMENFAYTDDKPDSGERNLTQAKIIGTFSVTQARPQEDILPPNRITDLNVVSINSQHGIVCLQWTAPGDDYDYGKAHHYVFKLSNYWRNLLDFNYNKENVLLTPPDGFTPENSGFLESLKLKCPLSNYNATYYIAVRAVDAKGNEARASNIIQIHFKEAQVSDLTTSSSSLNYDLTTTSLDSTEISNSTKDPFPSTSESTTTVNENMTLTTKNETKDGIFIETKIAIIAFSTAGAILLLLIIINIIVCCCCFRKKKKSERPKKLSRKESLRPPYNLNIDYKHGSQSSLDEENEVATAMNTMVDPSSSHSHLRRGEAQTENRYTYHTKTSLTGNENNLSGTNDLGFKVVKPMQAYATSSLSRFETRHRELESESGSPRSIRTQPQNLSNRRDAQMYPLGIV